MSGILFIISQHHGCWWLGDATLPQYCHDISSHGVGLPSNVYYTAYQIPKLTCFSSLTSRLLYVEEFVTLSKLIGCTFCISCNVKACEVQNPATSVNLLWPSDTFMMSTILVIVGSGEGLVPESTTPLPEWTLTYHLYGPATLIWE